MPTTPTLNSRSIRKAISDIEKIDFRTPLERDVDPILQGLFTGYKVQAPRFTNPVDVFRARISEKPLTLTELGPPPSRLVKSYGRGNAPGESVFYCCSSRRVPFFELECKPGDHIVMSMWRTSPGMVLNHIGFTEEAKERLGSNRELHEIYDFVSVTNNFNDLNQMVHEYIGYIFSRPLDSELQQHYFMLTSAIAQKMINGGVINGLMYPTVQMIGNADNIILKSDYFRDRVNFINAEYIRIESRKGVEYKITVVDSASQVNSNGELQWSGRPLHWELSGGQQAEIKVHDGQWIAEDENGNRVDPS